MDRLRFTWGRTWRIVIILFVVAVSLSASAAPRIVSYAELMEYVETGQITSLTVIGDTVIAAPVGSYKKLAAKVRLDEAKRTALENAGVNIIFKTKPPKADKVLDIMMIFPLLLGAFAVLAFVKVRTGT